MGLLVRGRDGGGPKDLTWSGEKGDRKEVDRQKTGRGLGFHFCTLAHPPSHEKGSCALVIRGFLSTAASQPLLHTPSPLLPPPNQAQEDVRQQLREFEETKKQIEEDEDREIQDIKTKYEKKLRDEKESNLRLKGETGIMRKKVRAVPQSPRGGPQKHHRRGWGQGASGQEALGGHTEVSPPDKMALPSGRTTSSLGTHET